MRNESPISDVCNFLSPGKEGDALHKGLWAWNVCHGGPVPDHIKPTFHVMGVEVCPTTKKEHIQGYIELNTKLRFKQLLKWFDSKDVPKFQTRFHKCFQTVT